MTLPSGNRAPRWVMAALAVSVALNLFFIGLAGGSWLGKGKPGRGERGGGAEALEQALPAERRAEFRAMFAASREERRDDWSEVRALRKGVMDAMSREPFDRDGYEAAREAYLAARARTRREMFDSLADFVVTLEPAQRAAFIEAVEKRRQRWRDRRESRRD